VIDEYQPKKLANVQRQSPGHSKTNADFARDSIPANNEVQPRCQSAQSSSHDLTMALTMVPCWSSSTGGFWMKAILAGRSISFSLPI
jgi:hypothetical protein